MARKHIPVNQRKVQGKSPWGPLRVPGRLAWDSQQGVLCGREMLSLCGQHVRSHTAEHTQHPDTSPVLGVMGKCVHTQTLPTWTGPLFYTAIGRNTARENPKRYVRDEAPSLRGMCTGKAIPTMVKTEQNNSQSIGIPGVGRAGGMGGGAHQERDTTQGKGMLCAIWCGDVYTVAKTLSWVHFNVCKLYLY